MNNFFSEAIPSVAIFLGLMTVASITGFILIKLGLFKDYKLEENRQRKIGRFLAIALGIAYILQSTGGKMMHFEPMVEKWDQFSMTYLLTYVGVVEFLLGILLLFPKSHKLAVLLLTAVAGGAMATHLPLHADGFGGSMASACFLATVWLSAVLYSPEMFPDYISRIFHKRKA